MKNYKLVHEAKDHFVLHDSNDNRQFKMPKKGISEKNYQAIKGLQKFADGGEVEDEPSDSAAPVPTSATPSPEGTDPSQTFSEQDIQNSMAGSSSAPGSSNVSTIDADPTAPVYSNVDPSTTASLQSPFQSATPDANSSPVDPAASGGPAPASVPMAQPAGSGQIAKGINESAKAQSDLGDKLSTAYGNSADQLQKNMDNYKTQVDALNQKSMDLFNSAQNDKVDPNHYWTGDADGKGAHSKISAGIALFLGGLGGGMSGHGGNVAADIINKNIDRDIDAQKTNINNKHTLISQNLAITGSVQAAESMTQSQLLAITAAQVNQANAQALGPEAVARKDQLLGQLKMQIQQANQKTAMLMSQARIANGQGSQMDLNMADPKTQARAVKLPNGQVALANSDKEAEDVRSNLASTDDITAGLDRLDKMGPEAGIPGTPENKEAQSLVSSLKFKISNNEGIKRHSPELLDQIGQQFGDPSAMKSAFGANGSSRTKALRQSLTDAQVSGFKHKLVNYQAPFQPKSAKKGFN